VRPQSVLVSAFLASDHSCGIVSWGTTGANDLTVTFVCFNASGAAIDARYQLLVIE